MSALPSFRVEGHWVPSDPRGNAHLLVTLVNQSDRVIEGFRLAMSGPLLIVEAALSGCVLLSRSGSFAEIAPDQPVRLAPGERWTAQLALVYKAMHWTDGIVSAAVIEADGTIGVALCPPTTSALSSVAPVSGAMQLPVAAGPVALSIIPWPNLVAVSGSRTPPSGLAIVAEDGVATAAAATFADLTQQLFPAEGLVRTAAEGGYPTRLVEDANFADEAYRLEFEASAVTIRAGTHTGYLYGLITLGQVLRGARLHRQVFQFPTSGTIDDRPAMGWRGCHFDVARQFYASEEVGQFVRVLAWNKLNRLHWHLSDDEAWRIEIDAYPELTRVGSWRGLGLDLKPQLGSAMEGSGGFYTKAAIRAQVQLAERLGITIVPEVDMPGHCYAMLQALPALSDPDERATYLSGQRFANNSLNPAVDEVYQICFTILGELLELFPGRWFHIGGDEVPQDAWQGSPRATELAAKLGGGVSKLQAHFLTRIQTFLRQHGRVTGAWEEAAEGGGIDSDEAYLIGWRTLDANRELAARGYDVVVSPGQRYYLDMANAPDWHEPGASWAGWSSPELTYRYDPGAGWSEAELAHLKGVQAAIWSEPMTERAVFDRLVFPRLSAIAETGWTQSRHKDWTRFAGASSLMPQMYGR
jgi:hexosaminidase